jgi:hypothetical protein
LPSPEAEIELQGARHYVAVFCGPEGYRLDVRLGQRRRSPEILACVSPAEPADFGIQFVELEIETALCTFG